MEHKEEKGMNRKGFRRAAAVLLAITLLLLEGLTGARAADSVKVKIGYYTYQISLGKADIMKYDGAETNAVIPSFVEYEGVKNKVVRVAEYTFKDNTQLESVVIPASIITLGQDAFENCINLKSVTVQGDIPYCSSAFSNTGSLSGGYTVTFGSGVTKIPENMFRYTGKKENEVYPFVKKVVMADTVKEVGAQAFEGCYSLSDIQWSANLEKIGGYAFHNNTSLKALNLPAKTKELGHYAFEDCTGLESIVLPASLKTMGPSVFKNCISLEKLQVNANLTSYADSFWNAGSLSGGFTAVFGQGVTTVPSRMFFTGANEQDEKFAWVTEVTLPDSVKSIGYCAFDTCYKLTDISIGLGLETVAQNAFDRCGLKTVYYAGSPKRWEEVDIDSRGNDALKNARMEYGMSDPPEVASIRMKKRATLVIGEKLPLTATVLPKNAETTLTWTSSDRKVAKVSSTGVVTAVRKGKATITVTSDNGVTAECVITVKAPAPTKVKLNRTGTVTLRVGKKLTLKARLFPTNAESRLKWRSTKPKVVRVSSKGLVTALKKGVATIIVTTANGKNARVKIRVK